MSDRVRGLALGIAALAMAMSASPRLAHAQDAGCTVGAGSVCSVDVTLRLDTWSVVSLDLSEANIVLPPPTLQRGTAGVIVSGPTAFVSANTEWQLLIATATASWSGGGAVGRPKPAADLQWSSTAVGPFAAMSQSPTLIATGAPGARHAVPTWFRALFDPERDGPGRYEITVNFTIVAP